MAPLSALAKHTQKEQPRVEPASGWLRAYRHPGRNRWRLKLPAEYPKIAIRWLATNYHLFRFYPKTLRVGFLFLSWYMIKGLANNIKSIYW